MLCQSCNATENVHKVEIQEARAGVITVYHCTDCLCEMGFWCDDHQSVHVMMTFDVNDKGAMPCNSVCLECILDAILAADGDAVRDEADLLRAALPRDVVEKLAEETALTASHCQDVRILYNWRSASKLHGVTTAEMLRDLLGEEYGKPQ